jgi:hypothetical protein
MIYTQANTLPDLRKPHRQKAELIQKYLICGYRVGRYPGVSRLFWIVSQIHDRPILPGHCGRLKPIGKARKKRASHAEFASTKT